MWFETAVTAKLGVKYPIVQGPFGGGPSSVELVSTVSNFGGLGSFGMQALDPAEISDVVYRIREKTERPFAVNLWIPKIEDGQLDTGASREIKRRALAPYFRALGIELPADPEKFMPNFGEQMNAVLEARPPVLSFVYGIPTPRIIEACRERGILMMGTATTVEEARALEKAGVDCIVASGFEAGGHKGAFLRPPEESLIGTFALVPQVADAVKIPVIAAGGIADARGVAAALILGAQGVQIGTAFLACTESAANSVHKAILFSDSARDTTLTRVFTGRLARAVRNRITEELDDGGTSISPFPQQGFLTSRLGKGAVEAGRWDVLSLSAGQAAGLVRHRGATGLLEEIVRQTPRLLNGRGRSYETPVEIVVGGERTE